MAVWITKRVQIFILSAQFPILLILLVQTNWIIAFVNNSDKLEILDGDEYYLFRKIVNRYAISVDHHMQNKEIEKQTLGT